MSKHIPIDPIEKACILCSLFGSSVLPVVRMYSMVLKNIIDVTKYLGTSRLLMGLLHNISLVFSLVCDSDLNLSNWVVLFQRKTLPILILIQLKNTLRGERAIYNCQNIQTQLMYCLEAWYRLVFHPNPNASLFENSTLPIGRQRRGE
jgi:hypothetical protein